MVIKLDCIEEEEEPIEKKSQDLKNPGTKKKEDQNYMGKLYTEGGEGLRKILLGNKKHEADMNE